MTRCSWQVVTSASEENIDAIFRIEKNYIEVFCAMALCRLTNRTSVPNHPASRSHSPEGYSTNLSLSLKASDINKRFTEFLTSG
jgi:hypothetical protein